jgi:hypothetical protein
VAAAGQDLTRVLQLGPVVVLEVVDHTAAGRGAQEPQTKAEQVAQQGAEAFLPHLQPAAAVAQAEQVETGLAQTHTQVVQAALAFHLQLRGQA